MRNVHSNPEADIPHPPDMEALRLAAIVESSDDAIISKDLNGIIQTWNRGAARLYGYTGEDVVGRSMILLLPPDRPDEEALILARIRNGERVEQFETVRLRKDGMRISVSLTVSPIKNADGGIVGASHIARNITDRTLMEAANAQLAAIIESSEDAIVGKNLDGVILTWNAGAERIYGYSAEEARWRPMSILLPPDRLDEEKIILDRLKRGERVEHFETVRVRKDGRRIHVSLTISPIRDNDGGVRGASHVARDMTERKAIEAQLLQTQKLESLGILAGGIAHDFNNLLVGILGTASFVADDLPASDPHSAPMADIILAAERASGLTRQLLAYAGKGRFVKEAVNVTDLVRETGVLIQASIPRHVHLRMELQEDIPLVAGDRAQIQQVVMNLLINAGEAIGDRAGRVLATTSVQHLDEPLIQTIWEKAELTPGQYVVVEVLDSGCGMDASTLENIFDPFFTTKFTGRGLGLAAVLGIVRGHKGALKVYSEPGKGSTFKLFFPVANAAFPAARSQTSNRELSGRGTILLVDDEEIVLKMARNTLEWYGYRVLVATDAAEGIEIFRRAKDDVALIVLDLTMPARDGEDALRELQKISPDVRVLLSSGFNEVDAIRRFTDKGLAGFIQKPYTSVALAEKVKQMLSSANTAKPCTSIRSS